MNFKDLPKNPTEATLKMIGCKWKILIIKELLNGTKRFGELKKSVTGITQKVLTSKLRNLEEAGLVERTVYPQIPPKVEYSLSERGKSLVPVLVAMCKWGGEHRDDK